MLHIDGEGEGGFLLHHEGTATASLVACFGVGGDPDSTFFYVTSLEFESIPVERHQEINFVQSVQ